MFIKKKVLLFNNWFSKTPPETFFCVRPWTFVNICTRIHQVYISEYTDALMDRTRIGCVWKDLYPSILRIACGNPDCIPLPPTSSPTRWYSDPHLALWALQAFFHSGDCRRSGLQFTLPTAVIHWGILIFYCTCIN